jgi:hypothetical protein
VTITRGEWLRIFGLAAFLWFILGAVFLGIITLAVAIAP